MENVPDQDLDAGRRTLVADGPEPLSAATQQQHFQHSPSLPHPPPLAGPYDQWFAEHQGYVVDLIQQEVNHSRRHPATVLPLHSLPVHWPKTDGPWKGERVAHVHQVIGVGINFADAV